MSRYAVEAIEYEEDPQTGSVCAICGQDIYEDPDHAGIPIKEAIEYVAKVSATGISDGDIEENWVFLS